MTLTNSFPWPTAFQLQLVLASLLIYVSVVAVYRLYFHPLAKFPGPKLAALTTWYNGYHDLVRGGQYVWVIEEMHKKYGPIVRTRPDTLHVNDPSFIDKLYSQSPKQRRERYRTIIQTLQAPGSILASVDHDLHRRRRAVLNPYFSQQNVRRLEPVINETLASLLHRMDGWAREGAPVSMNRAFRAATSDIIQAYAFGGAGRKYLDMEDCNAGFFDVLTPQRVCHLGTHVYWLAKFMANLNPAIMTYLLPRIGIFATFMQGGQDLFDQIEEIRNAKDLPEGRTIFHEIMRSDIPESEKETKRLGDEAMIIMIAGSETTASTLAAIMYHLLADKQMLARLKDELESVMPDPNELPVASRLDNLPFLNSLIQETIRLYPGATHRQDRVAPDEDLVYEHPDGRTFVIPAGSAVGMTAPIINRHPDLYERPDDFLPDRYLENPKLLRYQFAFSKGARQCIGMNLAYQELQTLIVGLFRRYDVYDAAKKEQGGPTLELFQTGREDIAMHADYITPGQWEGSQGLRVRIRQ
ncbi:Uu.00g102770.m01.CDS01 [Anthostomella pinea]|uniref:Uu.00g102770.m01.CDS01 n=1 Tax=Anthostomella pinea TaxID=933095 RepID=A0AAI8VDY5_9PEZI|nr:Uu.00g102770.m01.CDS01 [Anthostomella pinea]